MKQNILNVCSKEKEEGEEEETRDVAKETWLEKWWQRSQLKMAAK